MAGSRLGWMTRRVILELNSMRDSSKNRCGPVLKAIAAPAGALESAGT
jgi:hypothetical protein